MVSYPQKTSLIVLGITSLILSRLMFSFFDDPEGPNLLIVVGMASFVYLLSLAAYFVRSALGSRGKIFVAILLQIIICTVTFLLGK